MKKYTKILIAAGLCAAMLIGPVGCREDTEEQTPPSDESGQQNMPGEDTIEFQNSEQETSASPVYSAIPSAEEDPFIATPEPDATPGPNVLPSPTREPIEGDVSTGRFPAEDTGANADWSYQSDELRIAITRNENEEDHIVYYVADIWIRNINSFRMGFGNGKFNGGTENPEKFATREHAILGFSGSYNSGLVIHNGTAVKKTVEKSNKPFRSGVLIIYKDGTAKVINRTKKETYNYNTENELHGGIWHALQFGPVLVQNGEIQNWLGNYSRQPRIIFGYCEPGHYIAVAVDGRTKKSIGMTELEMAELMLSLGCTDAMNLDGGYSAAMLFMGKTINVPAPHRNGDGDVVEGRNIKDLLEFAEYDVEGNAPELSTVTADRIRGE